MGFKKGFERCEWVCGPDGKWESKLEIRAAYVEDK